MTALIDFCLLVNLLITIVAFLLLTEPDLVLRIARRRAEGERAWFDEPQPPDPEGLAVVRLWSRWMWLVLIAWGLMTGFFVGLYWQGWFWRF